MGDYIEYFFYDLTMEKKEILVLRLCCSFFSEKQKEKDFV